MNISIEIKAPELANAIMALASALSGNKALKTESFGHSEMAATQQHPVAAQPIQQQQYQAPAQQPSVPISQPAQAPTQPVQQQPIQQAPVQQMPQPQQPPQGVPTTAPSYSMDQLAVAATQLVDAGKREDLIQLLAAFGVNALTALPKEQYGAFATKLREMGAKI